MPRTPPSEEHAVRAQLERLQAHAAGSGTDPERIVQALLAASARLLDPGDELARDTRARLATSTGLSAPMIDWGLTTTLTTLQPPALRELARWPEGQTPVSQLIAVVLAGNVFAATIRALSLPLLAGAHVLAKAATADAVLARAWKRALDRADADVGARLEVTQFARDDSAATRMLCSQADALSIYGDDDTVRILAAQAGEGCRVITHGHGLSAAYVSREVLNDHAAAREAALRLALDVAAYDQRGCLSPQFVFVESGASITPRAFAQLLAEEALRELERNLPRGEGDNAAELQWQAVASVRGELFRAPTHAVSFEADQPARPSPGGRMLAAHSCQGIAALIDRLQPFMRHLKCLGAAADERTRAQLSAALSGVTVCEAGQMQTPAFDSDADGLPALAGLRP